MKTLPVLLFILLSSMGLAQEKPTPTVLVSVAPYKYFVERIAGDTATVEIVVPAGASSHSFEPTPKQEIRLSKGSLWFQIGESFEPQMEKALKSHNPNLSTVSLRQGVDLIVDDQDKISTGRCCGQDLVDPHIWMSPREAQAQVKTIANALAERYPENAHLYKSRLESLLKDLKDLDDEIQKILNSSHVKTIFVSHPAYAYYVRDYGLDQLSVEFEGKEPTPQQLTALLQRARGANIKVVFVQPQYSSKGARLIADLLHARVETVDPYSEDYMNNMLIMTKLFAGQSEQSSDDK